MWQRRELKNNAKQNLSSKYWTAFAVSLLVSLVSSGTSLFSFSFNMGDFQQSIGRGGPFGGEFFEFFNRFSGGEIPFPFDSNRFGGLATGFVLAVILASLLFGAIGIAYSIFVKPVVAVGGNRWFSRSRESAATPSIGMVFSLFKAGKYLKTVGSMLWMNLFLMLWGLLAVIPLFAGVTWAMVQYIGSTMNWPGYGIPERFYGWLGGTDAAAFVFFLLIMLASSLLSLPVIIKSYSYRMTPWILADNPQIGYKRALKLSMQLTRGHKWGLFVLDLSFIGWFLLGMMACVVGLFFVVPYYQAVQAELYARLRRIGADQGLCTMEELGYTRVSSEQAATQPDPEPAG